MSANTTARLSFVRDLLSVQIAPILLALLSGNFLMYKSIGVILLTALAFSLSIYFLIKLVKGDGTVGVYAIIYYWLSTVAGIVYLLNPVWITDFKEPLMAAGLIVSLTWVLFKVKIFQSEPLLKSISNENAYKEFVWFHLGFMFFFM